MTMNYNISECAGMYFSEIHGHLKNWCAPMNNNVCDGNNEIILQ